MSGITRPFFAQNCLFSEIRPELDFSPPDNNFTLSLCALCSISPRFFPVRFHIQFHNLNALRRNPAGFIPWKAKWYETVSQAYCNALDLFSIVHHSGALSKKRLEGRIRRCVHSPT